MEETEGRMDTENTHDGLNKLRTDIWDDLFEVTNGIDMSEVEAFWKTEVQVNAEFGRVTQKDASLPSTLLQKGLSEMSSSPPASPMVPAPPMPAPHNISQVLPKDGHLDTVSLTPSMATPLHVASPGLQKKSKARRKSPGAQACSKKADKPRDTTNSFVQLRLAPRSDRQPNYADRNVYKPQPLHDEIDEQESAQYSKRVFENWKQQLRDFAKMKYNIDLQL
ncbi:hypothetical protein FVE85_5624 [Porphyridium purpureum]|uniref:Uncharacterized protein n=1 Tax=Porphyridium purpureum TaxID=35688 RepID=A0A5J4Z274_PORPP|nr:hypothetical protein FVE85_5624 [Porphyridium purpureum]|eukprot:POR4915..scf295_1